MIKIEELRLNKDRIIQMVIEENEFTCESVKNIIERDYDCYRFFDKHQEIQEFFNSLYEKKDQYFYDNYCGTFDIEVPDIDNDGTYYFKINLYECYVDAGSIDYVYYLSVH